MSYCVRAAGSRRPLVGLLPSSIASSLSRRLHRRRLPGSLLLTSLPLQLLADRLSLLPLLLSFHACPAWPRPAKAQAACDFSLASPDA